MGNALFQVGFDFILITGVGMDDIPLDFIFPGQGSNPPLPDKDKPEHLLIPKIDNGYYRRNQDNGYHYNSSVGCQFAAVGPLYLFEFTADIFKKSRYLSHLNPPATWFPGAPYAACRNGSIFLTLTDQGCFSCFS